MNCNDNLLKPGERIDDLQFAGRSIIQSPDAFCFGMDSVLLADFASTKTFSKVCDLGTGTGILPILLIDRVHFSHCDAIEIQEDSVDRAKRSMTLNHLSEQITVHHKNLKNVREYLPHAAYDLVICNPPYSPLDKSLHSQQDAFCTARQENDCTFEDIVRSARWLLRNRSHFVFMLPASRLSECFQTLKQYQIEPKRVRFVHANEKRPARLILVDSMTDVHEGMIIEPPLLVQNIDGTDHPELDRIYRKTSTS